MVIIILRAWIQGISPLAMTQPNTGHGLTFIKLIHKLNGCALAAFCLILIKVQFQWCVV